MRTKRDQLIHAIAALSDVKAIEQGWYVNSDKGEPDLGANFCREHAEVVAHVTGEVRGLLCTRCNRGLGYFTLETLLAAVAYIEAYEQKRLISEPEIVLP